ncbi:MAG: 4Fe-4S binding protein [Candidatus Bathyarchaeota archaeon]
MSCQQQRIRQATILLMVSLFPVIYYYFSPYLVIMGASEGIVTGSLLVFVSLFVSSLFLGRVFCGWVCPAGATQELCARIRDKNFRNGKRNWIKYAIWVPWIATIILMFIQAGKIVAIDPLYQTYYGISISSIESAFMFIIIAGLILGIALLVGKRGACHTICWMAPFMIFGRKIRNTVNWSALQLQADNNKCINCKACNRNCSMGLDVNAMVQNQSMENSECILCGNCVEICPKDAIEYSFGRRNNAWD